MEQSEKAEKLVKLFKKEKLDGDNGGVLYRRHDCIGNRQCCRCLCLF